MIEVTAPAAVLAQRLALRGRETAADMAKRLTRHVPIPGHVAAVTVMNDASPAEGADRFIAALRAASVRPASG